MSNFELFQASGFEGSENGESRQLEVVIINPPPTEAHKCLMNYDVASLSPSTYSVNRGMVDILANANIDFDITDI